MALDTRRNVIPARSEIGPLESMLTRTQEAIDTERVELLWPSFGGPAMSLYCRDLEGAAFVFLTGAEFSWRDSHEITHPITGVKTMMPRQEVAKATVRVWDNAYDSTGQISLSDPQLATFQGAYILNQLRNASERDLIGSYVFTVARNPGFTTIGGGHPFMLKLYEAGKDYPANMVDMETNLFDDVPQRTPPAKPTNTPNNLRNDNLRKGRV